MDSEAILDGQLADDQVEFADPISSPVSCLAISSKYKWLLAKALSP